jgi:hypothetical protein
MFIPGPSNTLGSPWIPLEIRPCLWLTFFKVVAVSTTVRFSVGIRIGIWIAGSLRFKTAVGIRFELRTSGTIRIDECIWDVGEKMRSQVCN